MSRRRTPRDHRLDIATPSGMGAAATAVTAALPLPERRVPWPRPADETPVAEFNDRYTSGPQRLLDLAVAVPALIGFGLALPVLALLIRLDSPGPVFFAQERIGADRRRRRQRTDASDRRKTVYPGRPFRVLKLRTMRTDAEKDGPRWATANDARVTRVGRLLRKTRLDEVPQFWNVLRGEMSVVGPRPERLCFISRLEPEVPRYRERLLVRPGITGLAQVENGYDTDLASVQRKVSLDCAYIRDVGLRTDLRILLKTVGVVLRGSGAH
jgi:lipopolysaccharide/colanic/teichoic acid biosynthesis glycosyltransferase